MPLAGMVMATVATKTVTGYIKPAAVNYCPNKGLLSGQGVCATQTMLVALPCPAERD
jgi:hypothetical protein